MFLMCFWIFSVRNHEEFLFFYHAPHVVFHVKVKEITRDYVGPGAKQRGKRTGEHVCTLESVLTSNFNALLAQGLSGS
jgi:hypothetical protein